MVQPGYFPSHRGRAQPGGDTRSCFCAFNSLKSLFDIMLGSHRVEILPLCRDRHLSSSPLEMVAQSLTISPGC